MRFSIISKGDARRTKPDKVFDGTFEEFANEFKEYRPGKGKHDGYFVRGEITIPSLSQNDKKNKPDRTPYIRRSNEGMPAASVLVLDGDQSIGNENSAPDPVKLHKILSMNKVNHFIYTTHSYAPPEKNKWRCVIPCSMWDLSQLKPTLNKMFDFLNQVDYPLVNVKENWTWSQPWFLPNRDEDDGHYLFFSYFNGADYQASEGSEKQDVQSNNQTSSPASSHRDNLNAIREGSSYYKELQGVLYGFAKDGRTKEAAHGDIEMIMLASKASRPDHPEYNKWEERFKELPVYVAQAFSAISDPEVVDLSEIPEEKEMRPEDVNMAYPPGLMGTLCEDFFDMAPHPNQEISIMGGVCLVAGIVGRKYNVMGTGLNIYATLLADSGIGKAVLKNGINLALRTADGLNGPSYIGSSRFTGPKAIFDMLQAGHSRVCVLEESGLMNESAAGDQSGINRVMLDLYTSSGVDEWAGGEAYSDSKNSVAQISAPALTVLNVSTPKSYLRAMKNKSAELSGEIARMWMIRSMRDKPYLNINRKKKFDVEVIDRIKELIDFTADRQKPDQIGEVEDLPYKGKIFQEDANHFVDLENKYKREGDHLRRTLCSRAFVKIMKLSAVVSVFNGKDKIGLLEYAWAKETVQHEMEFIQDTFTHEASDDILMIVKGPVGSTILKLLNGKFGPKSDKNPKGLTKIGGFTKTAISQLVKNNVVIRELDDDPTRGNPKTGIEKCFDYMLRNGYITDMTSAELSRHAPRTKMAFKITEEFKLMMMDD